MNLLFFLDDNYINQFFTTLYSIFKNNESIFNIYIFGDISIKNINKINKYVKKNKSNLFVLNGFPAWFERHLNIKDSSTLFLNKFIFYCLPRNIDRILYLDCDLVVDKNITQFYFQDFDNKSLIVTKDAFLDWGSVTMPNGIVSHDYFNAGVLLINMKRIFNFYSLEKASDWIDEYRGRIPWDDQDLLNMMFYDDKKVMINRDYNYCIRHRDQNPNANYKDAVIIHYYYKNNKPWKFSYYNRIGFKIYWKYGRHTFGLMSYIIHYMIYLFNVHIHYYFGYFKSHYIIKRN